MLRDALNGLTVIDFTQIGAGPTCTMLLADLGARVIKVESPKGDLGRGLGPAWIGEDAALFQGFNRNKIGVSLDLKIPQAISVAKRLISKADVVVESMRPGVMSRLGLGHKELCTEFPSLVYCSISAYGQEGPYAARAGVDGIIQADSGLMSLIGLEDSEPCKVQAPVVDVMTGYVAAMAVLAKLNQRAKDGLGGHLDANLLNSALALQQSSITSYFADGSLPVRVGSAAPYSAPNQAFETKDGWIMVAAYMPERWRRFCDILGLPELADDARFSNSPSRVENRLSLVSLVSDILRTKSTNDWLGIFQNADILCSKVATYTDVTFHPQALFNSIFSKVVHPLHGEITMPGFPVNSVEENSRPHRPAPACGQHTFEILREIGINSKELEELQISKAIYSTP